jgi:hypothetical protein
MVVVQRSTALVQRTQRRHLGRVDVQLLAKMPPQHRRHDPKRVEQPAAHPQKTDLQRKAEPVSVGLPRIDGFALGPIEAEKRLKLEAAQHLR